MPRKNDAVEEQIAALAYIAEVTGSLARLAGHHKLRFLAHLLEMASLASATYQMKLSRR